MSDHVTMIHQGKIALDGSLQSLNSSHHYIDIRFADNLESKPLLSHALATTGKGRSWSVIHNGSKEQMHAAVQQLDGEIVESRNATLEEIFIARVGRTGNSVEAA